MVDGEQGVAMLCRRPAHVRKYEIAGVPTEQALAKKGTHDQ
jgi:hypothetical protein